MSKIKAIYDNPKFFDGYTVYFGGINKVNRLHECLCVSACPESPQGVSQFSQGQIGDHNGKKITFEKLPNNIKSNILSRGLHP